MSNKELIIKRALAHGEKLLGTDYSREVRFNFFPPVNGKDGGSFDCSAFVYACMLAAGYPLVDAKGRPLVTSTYEVNAVGFDLIYPSRMSDVGKLLPKNDDQANALKAKVLSLYQPGDIVFDNFKLKTPRANKITHVRLIHDAKRIIQTANNKEKCCYREITWGATHVCAIIRVPENAKLMDTPELKEGMDSIYVQRMQILLNVTSVRPKLKCDGDFGRKTLEALNEYKKSIGLPENGICDQAVWDSFFADEKVVVPVDVPDGGKVEIIGGSVNVRKGAGMNYPVLGIARKTERYALIGQDAKTGWYKISFKGKEGYVSDRDDLTKVVGRQFVEVLGGSVYVRSIGGQNGKPIGVAHKGEKYELLKVATTGWYQIKFNGSVGYISNKADLTKII